MPKVTFITASYNYAQYIGQTIESVISQTYQDWEMLVIDDGSKDNSIEVINSYVEKDFRIKLITHPNNENRGLIETLKLGIKEAQGEYIAFLESDDYIREDYLEKKLNIFIENREIGLVYNQVETFSGELSTNYKKWLNEIEELWEKEDSTDLFPQMLVLKNYIQTFSCVMLKKELLNNVNWKCPQPAWIDWWIWIQISQKTKVYYINEKLTYWRMHNDSYINKSKAHPQKSYDFLKATYNIIPRITDKRILVMFLIKKVLRIIKYKYLIIVNKVIERK